MRNTTTPDDSRRAKVLLLNPFSDVCYEATTEEARALNDHLFVETPLGITYVYTYVRNSLPDIDFTVVDAQAMLIEHAAKGMDYNWQLLMETIAEINPLIIGIGCYYFKAAALFHETCKRLKAFLPDTMIVAGGNYPTDAPEIVLEDSNVDYIVVSEGELAFANLLRAHFSGQDITSLPNVGWRDGEGKAHVNEINLISDIESIPIPDRSVLPMHIYGRGRNVLNRIYSPGNYRALTMTFSRGCPFACTFCTAKHFWGRVIRYRNTELVLDEMQILKEKYGADIIVFNDDNFLLNRRRASEVLESMMKRRLDLKWSSGGGAFVHVLNDDRFLDLVVKSGYTHFNLAIESSSEKTLRRIRKPVRIKEVYSLVEKIRSRYPHMWIDGYFMVGFPFETKENILNTLQFSQDLELDWSTYSIVKLYPNTELYQEYSAKGLLGGIDLHNPETFVQTPIGGVDWDTKWLFETYYEYNLRANFLNNRNLKYGNYEQALRDFEYVIDIAPDHALAYRQAALVADKLGDSGKATYYSDKEKEIVGKENDFTMWYEKLSIVT